LKNWPLHSKRTLAAVVNYDCAGDHASDENGTNKKPGKRKTKKTDALKGASRTLNSVLFRIEVGNVDLLVVIKKKALWMS
jgi:hypothetical protein